MVSRFTACARGRVSPGGKFFAAANYSRAELAYTRVVGYGETTPYYLNALYMQGWSRLKEGKYHSAIEPLIATLDHVMPDDGNIEKLPRGERELAQDSLRALAVTFSQLDGARSISQAFDQLGPRAYQPRLYFRGWGSLPGTGTLR